jgi:uncharacterized protein YndB with AHSA1/START domain/uncharacterized protein YciI
MNTAKRSARAIADVSAGTVLAVVEIEVPPERVFRALTTPDEVKQWWGSPELYRITESTIDLRVGGLWRSTGVGSDGTPFSVSGKYIEIEPPHRLVHTWNPDWEPAGGAPTTIRYQLEPTPTGTRVTVRHEGFGSRAQSCAGHAEGWERVLGWLVAHFADARAAEAPAPPAGPFFMCRLLAPRPTFAFDMTADERQVMQQHALYWRALLAQGTAIVFGPVADPKGGWGLGVVRAADEAAVRVLESNDPAIKSGRGFSYEVLPMLSAVFRA